MRIEQSTKNVSISILNSISNILLGLVAQVIFLKTLGEAYLGLNGIFVNVLSLLAIAELGIGTAIVFNLYKPISENNQEKILELIQFYKKCYRIIIGIMILISISITPFLKIIVGDAKDIHENIYGIFFLFATDIIISYMVAYKKTILVADQKEYIANLIHIFYNFLMNALQIFFLLTTKNYIAYLLIKIICRCIENVLIAMIVNKKYPFIKDKPKTPLPEKTKEEIIRKIKALFLHKIAGFIVSGTDTILISIFLGGLVTVGYYSNYSLIISAVTTVFSQIFSSLTASVGNMLVNESKEKSYQVFEKIQFLNFWLFCFASICIFNMIEPFISLWIGEQYILPQIVLISLIGNFFLQGMRRPMMAFKEAAGIFYEDRLVPVFEAIINIVVSILFLKIMDLAGVFLGTITSTLLLFLYSYPKFVYEPLFGKKGNLYRVEIAKYFILTAGILIITYLMTHAITINNTIIRLIFNMLICVIIPNLIIIIIYKKNDNFIYYKNLIKSVIQNRIKRRRKEI